MSESLSMVASFNELSRNASAFTSLDLFKSGSSKEKMEHAFVLLDLIKSRMTFLKANLKKGDESKRGNLTQTYLDITRVNSDIKVKLDDLWIKTNKVHIMSAGLKVIVFDSLAFDLLNRHERNFHQLSLRGIEDLPQNIIRNSVSLSGLSERQAHLTEEQFAEAQRYIQTQNKVLCLSASVGMKIDHNEVSQEHEARLHKIKQRVAKIKCARAIINCLLSFNNKISFENQSDLLELKMKYRCPPDITNE